MSLNRGIKFSKELKGIRVCYHGDVLGDAERVAHILAEQKRELVDGVIQRLEQGYKTMEREISQRMPGLVMGIVKRIYGGVELAKEHVENIVNEVLESSVPEGEDLEVILSAGDYGILMKSLGDELKKKYPKVVFKGDEGLKTGDCLVKSKFGLVDATIESKIDQIEQELG